MTTRTREALESLELVAEFRARARRLRIDAREMPWTVTAQRMESAAGAWDCAAGMLATALGIDLRTKRGGVA